MTTPEKAPDGYLRVGLADPQTRLRNPDRGHRWLEHGETVPRSLFWLRRLAAGDVVDLDEVEAAQAEEARAAEKGAEPPKQEPPKSEPTKSSEPPKSEPPKPAK